MPNNLAKEKSPYLLQHADNPVDWEPWGPAAFARARAEDKPVLVSVGYATCHWCHVMAHESFEDRQVAELLNREFVAIKVDREERPDVDHVYMKVCQALTGGGGWPLNVFVTPEGKPFYAGTYFPKTTRMGRPGFLEVVSYLAKLWQQERGRLLAAGDQITAAIQPAPAAGEGGGGGGQPLGQAEVDQAFRQLSATFDRQHGGFGQAPKFPSPHNLVFLLHRHRATGDTNALAMAEQTLSAMRAGGIFDQLGFGFHRYSVDREWLAPHFEKMLYDQALLAMAYLTAHQVTGKPEQAQTAREIFQYVLTRMTSPEGGFYSAEDADSEGEEGLYYIWSLDEIRRALSETDAKLFAARFDISESGNFEGRNIPRVVRSVAEAAALAGSSLEGAEDRLEECRRTLLAIREKRVPPLLDDKVLTSWNGLMIAALAMGGRVLKDDAYTRAAAAAADFVLGRLWDAGRGLSRRYRQGQAKEAGCLEDYAFLVWGLIELHQTGQDPARLEQAVMVQQRMIELFRDPAEPGFFYTPAGGEKLILRDKELYDGATPSGNSAAFVNLLRLARLTGNQAWEEMAAGMLAAFRARATEAPMAYTNLLNGVALALGPGREAVLLAEKDTPEYRQMLAELQAGLAPGRVILAAADPAARERLARLAPFTAQMAPKGGEPTLYLCQGFACQAPVTGLAGLKGLLRG